MSGWLSLEWPGTIAFSELDDAMKTSVRWAAAPLLLSLVVCGCDKPVPPAPLRPVRTIVVGDMAALTGREWPGKVKATEEVNLSFRVSGPLVALPIKVGQTVRKGDLLAQIDKRDFQVELASAQATLDQAKATLASMKIARPEEIIQLQAAESKAQAVYAKAYGDLERAKTLIKNKTIAQQEFDRNKKEAKRTYAELVQAQEALKIGQAGARPEDIAAKQAEIRSLEAAVSAAEDRLSYTSLVAPFDGEIATKYVENFETVQAKEAIVRLLDSSSVEMTVYIPEHLISLAKYAKNIKCRFPALGDREFPAEIKEIGAEASQTTRTYPLTLLIAQADDVKILPGMAGVATGEADLPDDLGRQGFVVPASAVWSDQPGKSFVWLVDRNDGTIARREVSVGQPVPSGLLVQGIEPGQLVATAGASYLKEGQKVRVLETTSKEASK